MTTTINNTTIEKTRRRRRRTRVIVNSTRRRTTRRPPRRRRQRNPDIITLLPRRRGPDPRSLLPMAQAGGASKDFLHCRVAPFTAAGNNVSVPDGSMSRKITMDHRFQIPFILGSTGSMNIALTPCLPNPVWFQAPTTDTYYAGGNHYTTWTSASYNTICLPEWQPGHVSLHNAAGSYDDYQVIFDSGRSRIITAAWAITYTGSTLNNGGSIRVNTMQPSISSPAPNPSTFTVLDTMTGYTETWNNDQIMIRPFGQNLNFGINNSQETRTIPLRAGAHGLLRHNNSDYQWCDLTSIVTFIPTPADDKHSLLNSSGQITSSAALNRVPIVASFDTDWSTTLLTISGAAAQSTFLLDVIYCVEYTPNPTNTAYPLAKPAPPRNDAAIQTADRIANAQPIASPGSSTSNTLTSAIKTASSVISTGATIASMLA